jgi:uncharacterized protein (TIGR02646 family)
MRPLDKKYVGDHITLYGDINDIPNEEHTITENYNQYGKARKVLLANFGNYCSYCEIHLTNGALFQTEHIQPKGLPQYAQLKTKWDNFLLSCSTCNSKKGDEDVNYAEIHLPHKNNTYLSLVYKEAGVVEVNSQIPLVSKTHAQTLISLLKLENPDSETDFRREMRRRAWDRAMMYLKKYEAGEYELNAMIADIKLNDCWSIWFTVFKEHREVREALVEQFPGTSRECFDADYNPIPRHPENQEDPI